MKKLLTFLFLTLTANVAFSQETKNKIDDTEKINQSMKIFGQFLKNGNEKAIMNIVSKNAEPHLEEKLKQIQKRLPKGNLFIEKISPNGKKEFLVVSQIKPFGIPLSIVFDNHHLIKRVDIKSEANFEFSNDYKLDSNIIVLPFHLIDGFMMVDGEINGKKGKLMFDTGTPFGLFLNNHYLELKKAEIVASGASGSGQHLVVYLDSINEIKIGNQVSYGKMYSVANTDFSFIEIGVEQDFLGFIGYEFIKNYEFIVDYDYQTITLYKINGHGDVINPYTISNKVLTTLNFTTPEDKQMPVVEMKLDTMTFMGIFDTGCVGTIHLNDSTLNYLIKQGILEQGNIGSWYGQYSDNTQIYNINKLNYSLTPLVPVKNYSFEESAENNILFGYQFLKNYITVWNYKKGTITLLQK